MHVSIYQLLRKTSLSFQTFFLKWFLFSGPLMWWDTATRKLKRSNMYTSLMTSRTSLIGIVSSSELPFLCLNCFKSTFRNPVHLVWVILSVNINHILRRPDRDELYDGCLSRKDEHLCHCSRITGLFWRTHKKGQNVLLVANRKLRFVCVCLHRSNPADVKLFVLCSHVTVLLSAPRFYTFHSVPREL